MPDEIQEWQQLHDKAMRFAAFAAKKVAALKAARKERVRSSHLRGLAWVGVAGIGAVKAWGWVSDQRGAVITGVASLAVGGTAGAAIACQTAETEARADAPRPPAIAAPPAQPERTPPTTKPPDVPRRAAPLPSPKPTEIPNIPDLQIPTTPLPIDSSIVKIPPDRTRLPRPPKVTPPVQPPTNPPGQTDSDTSDEDCLIKIHIGDLEFC